MERSVISLMRENPRTMHIVIGFSLVAAFAANIFGHSLGITIVLPHLFYIPIILASFFHPRRGIPFAVIVSVAYLLMVAVLRPGSDAEFISAAARCIVFVTIAAVVSYLSGRVLDREMEISREKAEWVRTFDAVPDLIALIGTDHRILRVNKALAERLGVSPQQAVGMKCYEVVHSAAAPPLHCPHAMLLKDRMTHTEEIHEDRLGGDFLVTTSPISAEDGTLTGSVHIARDITERRRFETALRRSGEDLQQKSRDLAHKVRELNCLYEIARLVESATTTDALLQSVAEILPSAWESPDQICARIVVGEREFKSAVFRQGGDTQEVRIAVRGRSAGRIEIFFPAEGPMDHRRFPAGETDFLSAVAERLGRVLERKEVEAALRETTEELDQYFSTSLDLFCIADTRGYFRRLNRQWERTLGYTLPDLEGKRFLDFVHPDDLEGTLAAIATLSSQKEVLNFTNRYRHRDGTYRWIEWRSFPRGDRIFAAARDITKRKQMEEALRESEEKYRTLVETSFDGIAIHQRGIIVYANRTAARILGAADPGTFTGRPALSIVAPAFRDRIAARVLQAPENPLGLVREQFLRVDGSTVDVDVATAPASWEGKPAAYVTFRDISAQIRAEEALRESEERYRTIIENITDVYFRFDRESRLVMVSPSAAATFGYSTTAEMLGISASSIWKDSGARERMIETMRAGGGYLHDWEAEFVKSDGTTFWASVSGRLHTDGKGDYAGTEGIIRDISERKKMEEALKNVLKKLNMLSTITRHDILNQVTGLRTFLELSREDLKGTRFETFIEKEDRAAEAIQRQIEFTRYYQDIGVNAPRWQDLGTGIREAVSQLNVSSVDVQVAIRNVEVFADPLIVKVFFNLMENSLRHGGAVTRVSFASRVTDTGLVITYCDNGVGIPAEDKKKLFRQGFGKHTGLGLFLSREILAITGITITENGVPGTGAQFEMTVPPGSFRFSS